MLLYLRCIISESSPGVNGLRAPVRMQFVSWPTRWSRRLTVRLPVAVKEVDDLGRDFLVHGLRTLEFSAQNHSTGRVFGYRYAYS